MSEIKGFKRNCQVLYSCKYQVFFCPKYSCSVLVGSVDHRLKEIIDQVAKGLDCVVLELVVMPDHVHILCEVDPEFGVHRSEKRVTECSSRLLRQEFPQLKSRLPTLWTHSYFVSTFGGAPMAIMKQSIENQKMV